MGMFYDGLAQILGLTALTSYGRFWLSLVGILMIPTLGWFEAAPEGGMGCNLLVWGGFSFFCSWAPWAETPR